MKLKDIAKLCKARGIITLTPVGGTQCAVVRHGRGYISALLSAGA